MITSTPMHACANGEWLLRQVIDDPAILGLGDLDFKYARPSCRAGRASVVFEDPTELILYVVELQRGPTDDCHVIRVVERWAAERKRHGSRRCVAVLAAEEIAPRYLNILQVIGAAVPVLALEMSIAEAEGVNTIRFAPVALGPARTDSDSHDVANSCNTVPSEMERSNDDEGRSD